MIQRVIDLLFGSKHEKDLQELLPRLHQVNAAEPWAMNLPPEDFPALTGLFRERAAAGESLDTILPEAFALVREAARRILGERPYDSQVMGGIVLHQGKIMEMKTGEGKTLSAVSAAYLNALAGHGVHVVTVNDYLAERDAAWMGPVYDYLGISVGVILSQMDIDARKQAYAKDITYGTNNEFGFDYLRDNMRRRADAKVQIHHNFCVIDEVDSILVDEARTPLIISGTSQDDTKKYQEVNRLVGRLEECEKDLKTGDYPEEPVGDYKVDEKGKRITFTDQGLNHMEEVLQHAKVISGSLFEDENFGYIHHFTQALRAHRLFRLDAEYVVKEGQVQIVDEFTGRILYGRRYSDGLHQAIEAKEGIRIAQRNRTLATITFQNFFRMYDKVSGMTGTAETEAKEFGKIYNLDVVVIPTNRPVVRKDEDDVIYVDEQTKFKAICDEIEDAHKRGQPMLVGTISIERSEALSKMLTGRGIRHEVLNAKNHAREATIIAEAGGRGSVTIATNMAGRGTDIKLGGNPEYRARHKAGTEATDQQYQTLYQDEIVSWRKQYEEVKEAGGLYVLGTERHESRRIDNQLRGRSGRQGDPGKSRFFLCLDDDLMRLFGKGTINLKSLMSKGLPEGEPLNHSLINKSIERAQTRVEERNFEIRKHLLEYDDVLNEQRKFIYARREEMLTDNSLKDRVLSTAEDVIEEALAEYSQGDKKDPALLSAFLAILKEKLFFTPETDETELADLPSQALKEHILEEMRKDVAEKEDIMGKELLNQAIRSEYLANIDARWQDHLENLEALREAVYLRSYAQKNPLLEYKLEGFQIFDELLYTIRIAIARKLLAVKAEGYRVPRASAVAAGATASHGSYGAFQTNRQPASAAQQPERVQIKRTVPKVGRNDPCPCGSGKKYKYCCGK